MKRQNYYQVHKNKRPRLKKKKINLYPILKSVFKAMRIVNDLVRASQPKPRLVYKSLFDTIKVPENAIDEVIVDEKNKLIKAQRNEFRKPTFDLSYKADEVSESFKRVVESINKVQMTIKPKV
jgi:hypothetical protein